MTLQWLFVAGTLYTEVALISILLLPFISPKTWQKLFRSGLASLISSYSYIYFNIFIAILVLLFLESIREVRKYSSKSAPEDGKASIHADNTQYMKMFRAQRNMYISGMALFLWIIARLLEFLFLFILCEIPVCYFPLSNLSADSVREVWKYSTPVDGDELRRYPEAETALHMKLFRAQRNMYIAGFALFLWFVLRRLASLIAKEATLMAECEASIKQAQSATTVAQQLLEDKGTKDDNKKNAAAEAGEGTETKAPKADQTHVEKELEQTQAELEKTKEELYRARLEVNSIKKQAESTNTEYDRLLGEHSKLQKQLESLEGGDSGDKKGK
ncbi:hypothetical protein RRG08_060352 [Elysia crispata]|uniref:Endoplasmic reticulum transmembrane protein n=1 Tax=Elysia crispata TaxID=231223 RepID=A0AAE1DFR5_9GAST|nr:hypothetical protein RRG08_060352 [Elysia crispata]